MNMEQSGAMQQVGTVRVRYAETDQMGVTWHGSYVAWLEVARTELMRELGIPYRRLEELGLFLPVIHLEIDYRQPANYDDTVDLYCCLTTLSRTRMNVRYELKRQEDDQLLCTGATHHAFINEAGRPVNAAKESPEGWALVERVISA